MEEAAPARVGEATHEAGAPTQHLQERVEIERELEAMEQHCSREEARDQAGDDEGEEHEGRHSTRADALGRDELLGL